MKIHISNLFKYILVLLVLSACSSNPQLEKIASLYEKTTHHYEQALRANPSDTGLRLKLGQFYYSFHDFQKVKELLKGIVTYEAKITLAKTHAQLKEYDEALNIFEQLGELDDDEYLFLYAHTLEEKNIFPKAVRLYKKVGPPLKERAQERIQRIGITIEEGVPTHIQKLLQEEKVFLSGIDKEEAVTLFVDEQIEIKPDNTAVASVHVIRKILKEKGKELGEVTIDYDSTDERVELEYARTITSDGRVVYAGKENIRDVSKYLNFPLYSNAKVFIISMPSIELGAIIEYKLKIYSSQLIYKDKFSFIYSLRDRYPIAQAHLTLVVPKTHTLNFRSLNEGYAGNLALRLNQEETNDSLRYTLNLKEIDPIIPEAGMPPLASINPAIMISNFSSWNEIYTWWHNLYKDKLTLDSQIKDFVKNLIKDARDNLEKAKRIYEFCAKDIRYVAVEYGESGYEPHKANEVFLNRYGDCKDKAILLIAMMREAGLRAFPVLIPTREVYPISEQFPSVNFNHAIAALKHKDTFIFMDATSPTTAFKDLPLGDQERNALIFLDNEFKILQTPLISDNEIVYETTIDIDKNENAVIKRGVTTSGFYAAFQRYYFKYTYPEVIKDEIQARMVQISPFSQLIDYKTENIDDYDKSPLLAYAFKTTKLLNPTQDLRIMPSLDDIEINVGLVGKEERNFPIEFEGIYTKVSKLSIRLASNFKVKYLPNNHTISNDWFDFKTQYKVVNNTIDFYQKFAIKKRMVAQDDYKDFKNKLEEVFFFLRERIILEKNE